MGDFHIFTSIRYDPALLKVKDLGFVNAGWNQEPSPFYMLDFHRDRMLRAAIYWEWNAAIAYISGEEGLGNLQRFLQSITSELSNGPQRVMITLAQDGTLDSQISSLPETHLNNLFPEYMPRPSPEDAAQVRGDKAPIQDSVYDILLDGDKKEVLLINDDGHIMEGSISTPYFWRDGKWVTPPIPAQFNASQGSGGNDGTTRRWALERGLVTEQVVLADSLVDGEECWISNGLRGFIFGKVKLRQI
ncbi:aminotransferase [Hypoxylon fuscum]|nr:aminotransferase [Hypoxylon fuscum]